MNVVVTIGFSKGSFLLKSVFPTPIYGVVYTSPNYLALLISIVKLTSFLIATSPWLIVPIYKLPFKSSKIIICYHKVGRYTEAAAKQCFNLGGLSGATFEYQDELTDRIVSNLTVTYR